ncbi:phosphatidylglycerophosphatase A family protein [Vagococcus vulneris]|uniref:Phosphatidylglycerophosphatase A n=1 Tax=Vagococcus vulneris TaxID=1977869 RepID=A0A429ZWM0_9ENTE|nr:phosphatidylglycerophosphatase A [Vagococcus vulneris]RST98075.1 phosphatidylglycerophosphatase A [Vagococcus vulneris]
MILNKKELEQSAKDMLLKRGVTMDDIADLVYFLQESYVPGLTLDRCKENIEAVLAKREVQNAIITGIQLDVLAEQKKLVAPLQEMLEHDAGLYGVDEILALGIVNVYGSIGFTNYGYIDKVKPGILAKLNDHNTEMVHTFLDDIVGAIAAAAASRLAHSIPE